MPLRLDRESEDKWTNGWMDPTVFGGEKVH